MKSLKEYALEQNLEKSSRVIKRFMLERMMIPKMREFAINNLFQGDSEKENQLKELFNDPAFEDALINLPIPDSKIKYLERQLNELMIKKQIIWKGISLSGCSKKELEHMASKILASAGYDNYGMDKSDTSYSQKKFDSKITRNELSEDFGRDKNLDYCENCQAYLYEFGVDI